MKKEPQKPILAETSDYTEADIELETAKTIDSDFRDQLELAVKLVKIYKKVSEPLKRGEIGFAEVYAAYEISYDRVKRLTEYIVESEVFCDQIEASDEDRKEFLSLDAIFKNTDHKETAEYIVRVNKEKELELESVLKLDSDKEILKVGSAVSLQLGKLATGAVVDIANSSGRLQFEPKEAIIEQNKLAYSYFEILRIIEKFQGLKSDIPKLQGQTINAHLKKLLLAGLDANIGYDALIKSAPLNTRGKELLKQRILGVIQEINGVNLFKAAGEDAEFGTNKDDDHAKDTLHRIALNGIELEIGIDWKASLKTLENSKNVSIKNIVTRSILVGNRAFAIDIVCTEIDNKEIKFTACLSNIEKSKRVQIERILVFRLSKVDKEYLRHTLYRAILDAANDYSR